jgi:hypothetical protein
MSSLTWLDFSEHERRQVLDVVKLFRQEGTVDELGIGAIRDGFADRLFPGTSTLHTRAGYLLFIPWIYQKVEGSSAKARDPWREARRLEVKLIDALAESDDSYGTIGIERRAALKTFPSTVYWAALAKYGIRLYRGGQAGYHRWITRSASTRKRRGLTDDEGQVLDFQSKSWDPGLPSPPAAFPAGASFDLREEERAYLNSRIVTEARDRAGESLIAHMIVERIGGEDIGSPWELTDRHRLPGRLQLQLQHAGCFALAIHGAPLLYNFMLAQKCQNADWEGHHADRLADWAREVGESEKLASWDQAEFWEQVRETPANVTPATRRFVDDWLDLSLRGDLDKLAGSSRARALIEGREYELKRRRARLQNPERLASWGGDSGTQRLSYRWDYVRRIVADVLPRDGSRVARN